MRVGSLKENSFPAVFRWGCELEVSTKLALYRENLPWEPRWSHQEGSPCSALYLDPGLFLLCCQQPDPPHCRKPANLGLTLQSKTCSEAQNWEFLPCAVLLHFICAPILRIMNFCHWTWAHILRTVNSCPVQWFLHLICASILRTGNSCSVLWFLLFNLCSHSQNCEFLPCVMVPTFNLCSEFWISTCAVVPALNLCSHSQNYEFLPLNLCSHSQNCEFLSCALAPACQLWCPGWHRGGTEMCQVSLSWAGLGSEPFLLSADAVSGTWHCQAPRTAPSHAAEIHGIRNVRSGERSSRIPGRQTPCTQDRGRQEQVWIQSSDQLHLTAQLFTAGNIPQSTKPLPPKEPSEFRPCTQPQSHNLGKLPNHSCWPCWEEFIWKAGSQFSANQDGFLVEEDPDLVTWHQ